MDDFDFEIEILDIEKNENEIQRNWRKIILIFDNVNLWINNIEFKKKLKN